MNFFSFCLIGLLIITLDPGCFLSSKTSEQNKTALIPNYTPASFAPPADSSISPALLTAWFACNNGLDSLSIALTDSMIAEKVVPCDRVRLIFRKAQDRLCVQRGLKSGYVEYKWILDNLGNSKNTSMYDSMKGKQ